MKNTTPMQALRHTFDRITEVVGKPLDLNQTSPKTWWRQWEPIYTKGVENEFIRIYKLGSSERTYAFAFNKISTGNATVTVSRKDGDEFITRNMNMDAFKPLLKEFAQMVEVLAESKAALAGQETAFLKVFKLIDRQKEREDLFEKEIAAINKDLATRKKNAEEAVLSLKDIEEKLEAKSTEIKNIKERLRDHLKVAELEAQLAKANEKIENSVASEIKDRQMISRRQRTASTKSNRATQDYNNRRALLLGRCLPAERRTLIRAIPKM